MMKLQKIAIIALLLIFGLITGISAQQMAPLPIDPQVRYGKLANGLTYYIRHNELPKNRAEFYIAQKVGSVLENDDQKGLAHFLEHMAFNGTKSLPGKGVLNYLESIGVKFGTNVNAYTGFDETVYNMSNVPVIREGVIDTCLLILHDWAADIALEDKEIDEERGVIQEEWRTSQDANMRLWNLLVPTMFAGSQYADRMPIGSMDVVMNFPYQTLKDYYHKWYRPDQQGIIVVGDIDIDQVEKKIKDLFGKIPTPVNPAERIYYQVPDNKEPIVVTGKDKEATRTQIIIFYKHEPMPKELKATPMGLINSYLQFVTGNMLNARFEELTQKSNPPFLGAYAYDGNFFVSKTMDAFTTIAASKPDGLDNALKALIQETERVNKFGFTASEYDRARADFMSQMEITYNDRDKQKNNRYVQEYVGNFTNGDPIAGIEMEYNIFKQIAPTITIEQVNEYIKGLIGEENVVITITGPDKEGIDYPSKEEILSIYNTTRQEELVAYVDNVSTEPLLSQLPTPGKINKVSTDKKFGTTIWTLSNGAKVVLKPTDFKNDEILMSASSKGGMSLYSLPKDFSNLKLFDNTLGISKIGNFSTTELQKALAGKNAKSGMSLGNVIEEINASCSPKDLRTMMQLVYLNFTNMNKDEEAFASWSARTKTALENMEANPDVAFNDSINSTLYRNNRMKSIKAKSIDALDYDRIMEIWKERFGNASDFTFTFVGNINPDSLRPLVEQYIASLPSTGKKEKPGDLSYMNIQNGNHVNNFVKEMETPKTSVFEIYAGNCPFTPENNILIDMFKQIMTLVYTATIREEEGGTYGVGTSASLNPSRNEWLFLYSFDTNPEMQAKLEKRAQEELMKVVNEGTNETNFNKVKEYTLKKHTEDVRENKYWLDHLKSYEMFGYDDINNYETLVNKQTPASIQKFVKKLFDRSNVAKISMTGVEKK